MSGQTYIDEQILKYRNKYRMTSCTYDLENEVIFIEGKRTRFVREELGGCFSIPLPEYFEAVPTEIKQQMFPIGECPQVVKVSSTLKEMLTFNTLIKTQSDFDKETDKLRTELNEIFPQDVFYTQGVEQSEKVQIHWFDFKHFSIEGEQYSIMFIFALDDNRGFLGTFRCEFKSYDSWKPCVFAMLRAISFIGNIEEDAYNA